MKTHIIIHHTAVSRTLNNQQYQAVKNYHIRLGWGDIGYNWLIEPNGDIVQGRSEHIAGAHCKEQSMNTRSIGVCLTGDFDKELPTSQQETSLAKLLVFLAERYNTPIGNIEYHRKFATYKSCPGKLIKENWAKDLFFRQRNAGRMFLQVQEKGEAWFVNPKTGKAEYIGSTPLNMLDYVRKNAVGITNKDLIRLK